MLCPSRHSEPACSNSTVISEHNHSTVSLSSDKERKKSGSKPSSIRAMLRNPFSKSSSGSASSDSTILAISKSSQGWVEGGDGTQGLNNRGNMSKSPSLGHAETEGSEVERKKKIPAPPGTSEYKVQDGDTLTSLAAQFDTTPSILKKLNRLTMDFLYPGQVLRMPNADYAALQVKSTSSQGLDKVPKAVKQDSPDGSTTSKPEKFLPGYILRTEKSCHSIVDEAELPPRPLTNDEAAYLDQECFERFIKINSFYITEHDGPVDGVLLVTPNAVMFDPNVSNTLVISKGAEEFGMIANMDTIMSAAIYHDVEAMECLNKRKSDPTVEKPPVYHSRDHLNSSSSSIQQKENLHSPSSNADIACNQYSDNTNNSSEPLKSSASFSIGDSFILNPANLLDLSLQEENPSLSTTVNGTAVNDVNHNTPENCQNADPVEPSAAFQISPSASSNSFSASNTLEPFSTSNSGPGDGVVSGDSIDPTEPSATQPEECETLTKHSPQDNSEIGDQSDAMNVSGDQSDSVIMSDDQSAGAITSDMVPDGLVADKKPTYAQNTCLFLCLRVGQSINKNVSTSCQVETYHRKIRPEYWFSIPREKVDKLYAFFIHWKSELYDNDDASTVEAGFIAITDDYYSKEEAPGTKPSPDSKLIRNKMGRQVSLDWEIVSLEEVRRRRTVEDIEKYMPLPDLLNESLILDESHIRKLAKCLPARVEGYPWALAFSSESNGFSLNQLYRNLHDVDSAVLLVICTTEDQIFGALSSCAFHTSDLFYGTGESFLFTYVDGFKTYPWSGSNSFFNKGDQASLSIGCSEGSYGLWIDGDIYLGRTQNCQTYANDPLTGGPEDFHIKQIEVWCFHDE